MMFTGLILSFIILFESGYTVGSLYQTGNYRADNEFENQFPASDVLWSYNNKSRIQCGIQCLNDLRCHVFFYCNLGLRCYGYGFYLTATISGFELETTPGMRYFKFITGCDFPDYIFDRSLGLCFKMYFNKMVNSDAENTCQSDGGHLIILDTEEKNTYISNFILSYIGNGLYWIGLTDVIEEDKWIWQDGRSLGNTFNGFNGPNPNSYDATWSGSNTGKYDADCASLNRNGAWDDLNCGREQRFICEIDI